MTTRLKEALKLAAFWPIAAVLLPIVFITLWKETGSAREAFLLTFDIEDK